MRLLSVIGVVSLTLLACACDNGRVFSPSPAPGSIVIPPPTSRTVSGKVREVNGGLLAGVRVTVVLNGPASGVAPSTTTDGSGYFTLTGVTAGPVRFEDGSHRIAFLNVPPSRRQPGPDADARPAGTVRADD